MKWGSYSNTYLTAEKYIKFYLLLKSGVYKFFVLYRKIKKDEKGTCQGCQR